MSSSSAAADTDDGPMVLRRVFRGAVAGAMATVAMSVVMMSVRRAGLVDKLAPRLIVESTLTRASPSVVLYAKPHAKALTAAAHLGFGMGGGAVFGLLVPVLRGPRAAKGLTFAAVVLLASYEGWVSAAGILPPLHRQRLDRLAELLVGHAVYGVVLGRLAS